LISRFYLEDYLSFNSIELEFEKGLVVFTGPSGAGKSIFFNMMVSLFGYSEASAKIAELEIDEVSIKSEEFVIEDEIIIKQTKTNKTRYFLNNQSIAKNTLKEITKPFFKHLHLKDTSDFENHKIIEFLDFLGTTTILGYSDLLDGFQADFKELKSKQTEYKKICEDEQKVEELIEFTKFEIEKIKTVNPQENEYEELKGYKELFTKKEKLESVLDEAKPILENSFKISKALEILEIESSFFDDTINEVENHFEKFYDSLASMEDIDLDATMERIDELSKLIKKYGSIKAALDYKQEKEKELEGYENISFEKAILEKNIKKLKEKIMTQTKELSSYRKELLKTTQMDMEKYLKELYLDGLNLSLKEKEIDILGSDLIEFTLHNIPLKKLSSGEFNRLRLALLTTRSTYETSQNGILFLDEIDANLSGKESESIGKVLQLLARNYQIFAISHQPQLSSLANQHFLIEKKNEISNVSLLKDEERIKEISRMISGENITPEAIEFAKKLLK
jgi:DNA repair protein RecN (Recombination protein N)